MERYDEVMAVVCQDAEERTLYGPLVREFVQLEHRLDELRELPQIKVHPTDPTRQKPTAAHKQYKELLQQYTNIAKVLGRIGGADAQGEESPLRAWARARAGQDAY